MLLAIVSKMFKEGLLSKSQRGYFIADLIIWFLGILKDLIIENDSRILNFLKQYEIDGDRNNLYRNFVSLSNALA